MGLYEMEYETFGSEMKWTAWKLLEYPSEAELTTEFSASSRVLEGDKNEQTNYRQQQQGCSSHTECEATKD